jgi:serine/threonine protein kinase
MDSKLVAAVPA